MNLDDPAIYETLDPTHMWRTFDSFADTMLTHLVIVREAFQPQIDVTSEASHAREMLIAQTGEITISKPAASNPAKRIAGQLIGRLPIIVIPPGINSEGYEWKTKLNNIGKNFAQVEPLDMLARSFDGFFFPRNLTNLITALILRMPAQESPQDKKLMETARELFMQLGIAVDVITGRGDNELAQMLTLRHLGDYVAYYVAIANGVDPALRPATDEFQARLAHPPSS